MFLSGITIQSIVILIIIILTVLSLLFYASNRLVKKTKYYKDKIENKGIIKSSIFHLFVLISSLLITSLFIYLTYKLSFD